MAAGDRVIGPADGRAWGDLSWRRSRIWATLYGQASTLFGIEPIAR
jgi:hypothetical protein